MTERPLTAEQSRRGTNGEARILRWLCRLRDEGLVRDFFRPDWVVMPAEEAKNVLYSAALFVEGKAQEHFERPPFDGHGLPVCQAENYQAVLAGGGPPTLLVVIDGGTVYHQYLHILERGRKFDTNGAEPRRVYPLESFTKGLKGFPR